MIIKIVCSIVLDLILYQIKYEHVCRSGLKGVRKYWSKYLESSYLLILSFSEKMVFSIGQLTLNDDHSYSYHWRGKILFSYLLMHHHSHCWDQHWWCVSQTIEENHRHQSQYIKRGIIIVVINIIIDADLRCFDCSYSFG